MAGDTITARFAVDASGGKAELKSLGDTGRDVGAQLAAAADGASAATDKQLAKYRQLGEQFQFLAQQRSAQDSVNANVAPGLTRSAPSAAASASVFQDQAREEQAAAAAQEALTQRANALRGALEPLFAAEVRRNIELAEANSLLKAGAISEATHAAAVARTEGAYRRAEEAAGKSGKAVGLNNIQVQEFGHIARSVFDSLAAGASPFQIAAFEGGRFAQTLGEGSGGAGASVKALFGIIGTWAPLITGVAVIGALAFAAISYANAQDKATAATQGWGRASGATTTQVLAIADAAQKAGQATASAARGVEEQLLNTGKVSGAALQPATTAILNFAQVSHQTAADAAKQLVPLFSDPAQGAKELTEKLGLLSAAEIEHINSLVAQGQQTQAQIELTTRFNAALDTHAEHIGGLRGAWESITQAAGGYFDAVGHRLGLLINGPTTADQVASLRQQLADAKSGKSGGRTVGLHSEDGDTSQRSVAQLQDALNQELAAQRGEDRLAQLGAVIANRNRQSTIAKTDIDAGDTKATQIRQLQEKLGRAKTDAADPDLLALSGRSKGQADAAVAGYEKQIAELEKSKTHHDAHAASVARDTASMEANTAGALSSAEAYLKSSAEGEAADAKRQASRDALRKGEDVDGRVKRQTALSDAQAAETGAKSVAKLRDETDAREALNKQVASGAISAAAASQQLQREAQLRGLVAAQASAQRTGDIAGYRALTAVIADYGVEQARARDTDGAAAAAATREASAARVAQIARSAQLSALRPGDPRRTPLIREGAEASARNENKTGAEVQAAGDAAVNEDRATKAGDVKTYEDQTTKEYQKQSVLLQAQLAMAGVSAGQRALLLADLQKRQEFEDRGVDANDKAAQAILEQVRNEELLTQAVARANAAYEEVHRVGESLLDDTGTLFENMDKGWSGVEDTALSALKEIESELFKLALINPWKNALFGENLPTLGSAGGLGGFFSSLIGGGRAPLNTTPIAITPAFSDTILPGGLPGFANGTDDAPPGYAWVGERGRELVKMMAGAQVVPNPRSEAMAAAASAPAFVGASPSAGGNVIINDHRSASAPPAKVTRKPNGDTHVDLYPELRRGMRSYVQGGDYERDVKGANSQMTRRV